MFIFRILLFTVAFVIVAAEFWAGAVASEPIHAFVAIPMGGAVIALLLSISMFLLANQHGDGTTHAGGSSPVKWVVLLTVATLISGASFLMPQKILPMLSDKQLVSDEQVCK